jgi:hypothetical protein
MARGGIAKKGHGVYLATEEPRPRMAMLAKKSRGTF